MQICRHKSFILNEKMNIVKFGQKLTHFCLKYLMLNWYVANDWKGDKQSTCKISAS